ncbi:MAG: LLM class flavin-dependent oxidoreductase [Anaerolineae bacterium]|nr:LLM class flavin-dependent oxidoreductase [Anaerolineae bacterium]
MDLGIFMMPLHPPERRPADTYQEDVELLLLAERLGFTEAWIGEHGTMRWENIPAPDQFIAYVAARTERIRLGTGVVLMAQHHPANTANRLAQLERRRTDLERELAEQAAVVAQAEERLATAAREVETAEADHFAALEALNAAEREYHRAEDELAATAARLDQLRQERDSAREAYQSLSTQFEVLRRARSQALHLHSGSQAVIRAGLPGVIGTVASLITVPRELEAAIEAALGAHLQDVVVRTWEDAVACIEHLKRTDSGRATFLPLDYIRPHQPVTAPAMPGVRGIAARLVKCEPELRPVSDLLLGNIVIVDDLAAGRKALAAERRLRQAVTLDADVIEARGVMRGGSRPRGRSILSQEREWRDLPARLATAEQALAEAEARVRAEEERQQACRALVRDCAQRMQSSRETASQQEQRANVLRQRYDRLLQDLTWRRSLEEQARRSFDDLQVEVAQIHAELGALESSLAEARQRIQALRSEVERDDLEALRRQVAECETALAISVRTRHAEEQLKASQAEALTRALAEAQARRSQLERLRAEAASLAQESERLSQSLQAAEQARQAVAGPLAESENTLQSLEEQRARLEAEEDRDRQQLQAQLSEVNRLSFERERASEDIDTLKRQIESELGPVEVPDPGQPTQLRLNLGPEATPLPAVTALPEGLSAQVRELRARLRRLGPVNPSAPSEYAEVLQRHRFLSEQIADLSAAADSARQIIADLNQLIRDRFTETFGQVAREFSACFTALFNGGSARLVLTDPENPAESGIDIVARPPGKRSQSLALLSGGERALTAVALLFAMLKVNPLPFCVLDEVDATLDEANVHRFRRFLTDLAQKTQFIVITHNRGTVESASTIYGISMTRGGVSQVLSLALPAREETEGAPAEPAA